MQVDMKELIEGMSMEYGGDWGIYHTRRILAMIDGLDDGTPYDRDAVWIAAHLHDWGGYKKWILEGVDHADRSAEVAQPFLEELGLHEPQKSLTLECIQYHHRGPECVSLEAKLLADADALDFLGVTGVLRDFSKTPRDLRKAHISSRKRMEKLPSMLQTEKAKELATQRLESMNRLFKEFEAETAGIF